VSQADYTSRGVGVFTYEMKGRVMTTADYEVPPDVLKNALELTAWARRAIGVADNSKKSARRSKGR
jgi:TfoX/Sxy family transcriptional regulator of competence genes